MKMFFKYLINSSWEQKKLDWQEYKQLGVAVENARQRMDNALLRITYFVEPGNGATRMTKACVLFEDMSSPADDFDYSCQYYCHSFDKQGNCKNTSCLYWNGNVAYRDACNAYDSLCDKKRYFWKNKFLRMK